MQKSPGELDAVLAEITASADQAISRLVQILEIPSVSADPAHDDDCLRAAEWVAGQLEEMGFACSIEPTGGKPAVIGSHPGPAGKSGLPTAIFYSHYDVQPADPVELWNSPPFEPMIADGPNGKRIFARGASDNKGQLVSWIEALRACIATTGTPPMPVKFIVEGEEEVASPHLDGFLEANRDRLAGDVVLANDASMWDIRTPALVTRLRGMLYTQIDLFAASQDLHSGLYGGAAVNPLDVLVQLLAGLHDGDRRVTLPGFYDAVEEVSPEQKREWDELRFDEAGYLSDVGLATAHGETGRGALERLWARPTAEINGIWGGYSGSGSKTVIPADAHAKLSFRLVPDQDPEQILATLESYVAKRLPADVRFRITKISSSHPTCIETGSVHVKAALRALGEEFSEPVVRSGTGGTLPVVNAFTRHLGVPSLLYGWAQNDDNPHSPNEKFELALLEKGARAHARILHELAELPR